MQIFREDKTTLKFPLGWSVTQWDGCDHYTDFSRLIPYKVKAVDFICTAPDSNAKMIFIEVKDYRLDSDNLKRKLTSKELFESLKEKLVLSIAGLHFTEKRENRNSNSFNFSVSPQRKLDYVFLCFYKSSGNIQEQNFARDIGLLLTKLKKDLTKVLLGYDVNFKLYSQSNSLDYSFTFELSN